MLCLKKRRTYSFTQGVCADFPRRSKKDNNQHRYEGSLNMAITTLPRKNRSREERPSRMVLTVTEDTPADMLAGSMELRVQLPRDHQLQTQRVTVQRSTPMMDLLVQIATAHKLAASSYTLQAIGERGLILPHQPNTPIGALDALQVKLLPKQGTFVPRKTKQANQPFETTFRLQVHLPRNQLYVSRVSPKMNLGEILDEVCREKNLDKNKYELRHPANLEETLDLSLSLQDYHLQEVTLYAKQGRTLGSALSTQDIMALQRQEERRRQQARQGVFGFTFKKSKEGSLSTDSLGGRSASPARSDETGRSASPLQPPARPQRKRRPAPKPPIQAPAEVSEENSGDSSKDKVVISHSRNSSDSSGYHEASILSDNPDSAGRLPETLPRRSRAPTETPRKLAHTSQSSKSLGNLATVSGTLAHGISSTSLSSTGLRKKRAAPPPPVTRPLSSAISTQALERIVDSEESLTSDIDPSKPPSDIGAPSKANSDIEDRPKASSDIGVTTTIAVSSPTIDFKTSSSDILTNESETESKTDKLDIETRRRSESLNVKLTKTELEAAPVEEAPAVEARVTRKRVGEPAPFPKPRNTSTDSNVSLPPQVPKRRVVPLSRSSKSSESRKVESLSNASSSSIAGPSNVKTSTNDSDIGDTKNSSTRKVKSDEKDHGNSTETGVEESGDLLQNIRRNETIDDDVFLSSETDSNHGSFENHSIISGSGGAINPEAWKVPNNLAMEKEKLQSNLEMEKDEDSKPNGDDNIISDATKLKEVKTPKQNKKLCAVISTLPKCDHLDYSTDQKLVIKTKKVKSQAPSAKGIKDIVANDNLTMQNENDALETIVRNKHEEDPRDAKRLKIVRSASKLNDFEVNSLEKQKRHLTSHAEDITFALNLNLSSNVNLLSNLSKRLEDDLETRRGDGFEAETSAKGVCEEQLQRGLGISDTELSETDILLQKVSDTLSNSMPVPISNEVPTSPSEPNASPIEAKMVPPDFPPAKVKPTSIDKPDGNQTESNPTDFSEQTINASTPNVTLGSQQDTSDYVSAVDEDLSIAEWEYQLPAPPSAFRDTASPVFDNFDTARLTEDSKDTEINLKETETIAPLTDENEKVLENVTNERIPITESVSSEGDIRKQAEMKCPIVHHKVDDSLKKEMICELENKIGSLPQKEFESRKMENPSTPRLAPVDNTLSNFTITTYTRQKSLNIFDEVENQSYGKIHERSVRSLATLPRNRKNSDDAEDTSGTKDVSTEIPRSNRGTNKNETVGINVSCGKLEPKMNDQQESLDRWQVANSDNEKSNIQRSESYVSTYDNMKHRRVACENDKSDDTNDRNLVDRNNTGVKRSTSITNLNGGTTRNNEKFSQWRENILKRQEEPTKERQLQSLQVLKSILPQLKSAQQAEENVSKENNDTVLTERTRFEVVSNEHSTGTSVVLPGDSQTASHFKKVEQEPKKSTSEINTKRYTYSGPPAISLGSWTERPSINVQIKTDTDYKFGVKRITNGRTIVNINGAQDEVDCNSRVDNDTMSDGTFLRSSRKFGGKTEEKREPDELTKKLITHTTALGFKKSTSSKDNSEFKTTVGTTMKPVVTGVELKKTLVEKSEPKKDDSVVDTSPLNFKELTKAFGQDISLRPKPKRFNTNRHSDLYSMSSETIHQIHASKQNGHSKSEKLDANDWALSNETESNSRPKRFTSIVGVNPHNQNQNFVSRNNLNIKNSNSMPVVKGFKMQNAKIDGGQTDNDSSKSPSKEFYKDLLRQQTNGGSQPPRPPTMPVITGVTLKSANVRPKSMPAQADARDTLLESIRNFGGRDNLKSTGERC